MNHSSSTLSSALHRELPPGTDEPLPPFLPVVERPPLVMSRGAGSYLWDEDGRRYLDVVQGWATNALGHGATEVLTALAEQSSLLVNASPAFYNRPAIELARLLTRITGTSRVAFLNSGAEATETAIKLARKWGQRFKRGAFGIVSARDGFHGRTLAAMAASGKTGWEQLFPPYPPGFMKIRFGEISAVERAIDDSTVAILVEPIQGEAGVVTPPDGYLAQLRALADHHDLLLILDEVQTGVGRTGSFLAQEAEQIQADVTLLGKGLGAGMPISAVLCNERAACFELGDHGSTHGGNPLLCHVALAVVRCVLARDFLPGVRQRSALLQHELVDLAQRWGRVSWRGKGMLQALVFEEPIAAQLSEHARTHGLLVNAARPNILRFMPQLRISPTEIAELCELLQRARSTLVPSLA